jgi:hypothetical protein
MSAVKWFACVCDRMPYTILRGCLFHIIVLNVHAPTEDKIDGCKGQLLQGMGTRVSLFPKYHMQMLLGDFNTKVCKENIFRYAVGNERLHEISNDNGVNVVNSATSKILTVESTVFPHRNIHKYTGCLRMHKPTIKLPIFQ